jgi:hypothetical protein
MKKPATVAGAGFLEYRNLKESLAHTGSVGANKINKKEEARLVPGYGMNLNWNLRSELEHMPKPTPDTNLTSTSVVVKPKEAGCMQPAAGSVIMAIRSIGNCLLPTANCILLSPMPVVPPRLIVGVAAAFVPVDRLIGAIHAGPVVGGIIISA